MLRQNIGWFDESKNSTGALTSKLASQVTLVECAVGPQITTFTQNICTVITGLTIAFVYVFTFQLEKITTSHFFIFSP
jgi:ATP-binding cassette subfamily B (MDR/TAP) protein 1